MEINLFFIARDFSSFEKVYDILCSNDLILWSLTGANAVRQISVRFIIVHYITLLHKRNNKSYN